MTRHHQPQKHTSCSTLFSTLNTLCSVMRYYSEYLHFYAITFRNTTPFLPQKQRVKNELKQPKIALTELLKFFHFNLTLFIAVLLSI